MYRYKPTRPDEQWHIDIMYIYIKGRWYFFVGVLDSYSRYIVYWDLVLSMDQGSIKGVIQEALEKNPGKKPRIVHDNGSQFISKEWRKLIKEYGLEDIRTRKNHPESNGKIERFHRTIREALSEEGIRDYWHAIEVIGEYVRYYNEKRLHAGIRYLRPVDYYRGNPEERIRERKEKLEKGLKERIEKNKEKLKEEVA
ncbi:MAG: DDE-type integrase/transposase/recombinase [candidate division WOR-3 bacterium]